MSGAPEQYDVVIAGAGPGGTATATFLARQGKRVLILEKQIFPRFVIGESLLPYGNDVLHDLGVWDKICGGGFMPKFGAEFCTGDKSRMQRFWFGRNLGPRYEQSFQVERAKFDQLLLDHAREHGASVIEGAAVKSVENPNQPDMRVVYEKDGVRQSVGAKWLVDATGREAVVGGALGFKRTASLPAKRLATYGHFRGVFRNSGKAAGHITIVRLPAGWMWFIPLDEEKTSVGLVLTVEEFRKHGSAEAAWNAVIPATAEAADRLKDAERIGPFHTTGDYSYRFSEFATERVVTVGDAAGFLDPIFSSGVMMALKSAQRAAKLIATADAANRGLTPRERAGYTRQVGQWMLVYSKMIAAFYSNAGFEVFMNPAPVMKLPWAVAHVVGGNTDLSWELRARLGIFYAVCWLQQKLKIAPRIGMVRP
jgi:flavin-dependent dehydrogenase